MPTSKIHSRAPPDQPRYAKNAQRSRCVRNSRRRSAPARTSAACLKERFKPGDAQLGTDWPGGFFCPCHGSRFDMAGRVFNGSPASLNLAIPPHSFASDTKLVIGVDPTPAKGAA
jgi:ubiquinol-cytochrome c reductase iron-sulfur subunit